MIGTIISTLIMVNVLFIIWASWLDKKYNIFSLRNIIIVIFTTAATLINYFNMNVLFKIFTETIIFVIIYMILFKTKLKQSIAAPIITQTLYLISETIVSIIMLLILNNNVDKYVNNYFGTFVMNIVITIIVYLLNRIKIVKRLFNKFNRMMSVMDDGKTFFISLLILFLYNICGLNIFFNVSKNLLLCFYFIDLLLALTLVLMYFKSKDDYYKMLDRYNSGLLSLKELENSMINHRIDNHENKNHLLTIRNMTKNKKVTAFIDTILENNLKDDNNLLHETSVIPTGGLRGLIYSKLLIMKNKEIDYELDVSNTIVTLDMLNYDDETMLDICKIVGIFLDNAIEEMDNVDDKYIIIELYLENEKFVISISNNYDNSIEKNNIYESGVTTKGKNHGYGLSLVKKIIKHNKALFNKTEITENEFTQILIVNKKEL